MEWSGEARHESVKRDTGRNNSEGVAEVIMKRVGCKAWVRGGGEEARYESENGKKSERKSERIAGASKWK